MRYLRREFLLTKQTADAMTCRPSKNYLYPHACSNVPGLAHCHTLNRFFSSQLTD
jgi:hypothetical protein